MRLIVLGPLTSLAGLLEIAERREKGPATTFEGARLLLAFITIGGNRVIGRGSLASRSGLGAGAVRTILKKLREDGYVDTNASGCFLTPAGKQIYESIWKKISPPFVVENPGPAMGRVQVALTVRQGGDKVRHGIEQRDSAIKVGAAGAITYVVRGPKFTLPGDSIDCEREYPSKLWNELRRKLSPRNGDALVLCGAAEEVMAKVGALSAALTLL